MNEEIKRANARAEWAEQRVAQAEERAARAEAALQAAVTRVDDFRARMIIAETDAEIAQVATATLRQAEASRRAMPLWVRLRAAWRGT